MTRLLAVLPFLTLPPRGQRLCRRSLIAGGMTLLVVVGMLALPGCGGEEFPDATATDLENRTFTVTNGAGASLATLTGLPVGQAFTLRFGSFGGTNTAPVSLESAGQTATGTVTIGSCAFQIDQSSFAAGQGPQAGAAFTIETCQIDRDKGELRFMLSADEVAIAVPTTRSPTSNVAFVLTSDGTTGSYTVVDLASRQVFQDINRAGVHNNAVARFFGGRVYVVNRLGGDSIRIIEPQQGFITPPNGTLSVGQQTNPQDMAFVHASKAYVSRLNSSRLLIVNPTALTRLGELDLSTTAAIPIDADGSPDPAFMLVHNGLLYVALQHIESTPVSFSVTGPGQVAVIDTTTDQLVSVIQLRSGNPISALQFSPTLNRILVSSVGYFNINDGGIEAINPDTQTVDARFVIDEASIGGDITAFAIASRTKGFAIVRDASNANALVTFDPSTGQRLRRLLGPLTVSVPHLIINSRHEIYLATADGLRIFDTESDSELTATPLNVGQFPPVFTLFIEP